MSYQMDSIWIEDENSDKLYVNNPNVQLINSETPILLSKNNIELPPLPPSSFFQSTIQEKKRIELQKKQSSLVKIFKKLSFNKEQEETTKPKKISTPFHFNHISHINQETPITNKSFQLPSTPKIESGISFNTTSPRKKKISSISNSASINSNLFQRSMSHSNSIGSNLFQRTGSISTLATSIESDTKRQKHKHTDSSSSIENLKKLEKNQISKQCSINYTSNFKYPKNLDDWDTPDSKNVVRQSWIYEEMSPFIPNLSPESAIKKAKSISYSPSYHYNSPLLNKELNLFQNEMEISFSSNIEFKKILTSIDTFDDSMNLESDINDDNFNEAIASLRAAKFTRLSRMEGVHKLNAFNIIEDEDIEEEEEEEENLLEEDLIPSEPESTPTQHKIGVLLPSILD